MIDQEFANRFAEEWIEAWNSHDLDRVLLHYEDDFEMSSPLIASWYGIPNGVLIGKQGVRDYWSKALKRVPELHFELVSAFYSAHSVAILYKRKSGEAVEVLFFNHDGKVHAAAAHY